MWSLLLVSLADLAFTQAQNSLPPAEATYRQGLAALQSGDLATARVAFEHVVKVAPGYAEGHNLLGWVLLAQEHVAESISQFRIALRLKPDFAQAHMNLANALARSGDLTASRIGGAGRCSPGSEGR